MNIFDILVNLFESAVYVSFVFITFKKKCGYIPFIITLFLYFCTLNFFNYFLFLPDILLNLFVISIIFLYSLYVNKMQYIQCLFITLLIDCINDIASTTATIITSTIYGFPFYSGDSYIFLVILSKSLLLILSLIVSKYITTYQLLKAKKLKHILVVLISILFLYSSLTDFIYYNEILDMYIIISFLLLNILSIFVCIIFFDSQKEQLEKLTLQKDKLKLETQEKIHILNQSNILEMRKWKHDMKHVFLSINHFLKKNEIEEAISILEQQNQILNKNDVYTQTGNEFVDSILIERNSIIKENNIHIITDCKPCPCPINHMDFFVIVGNLLDNAIEACSSTEQKQIMISISMQQQYYCIKIRNSVSCSILKNNPNLITTKDEPFGHGFGILNVRKLISSYHGKLDFDDDGYEFLAKVILPLT